MAGEPADGHAVLTAARNGTGKGTGVWSRDFRLLFTARTVSLLGDAMLPVALIAGVIAAGYGASGVGYALAARVAPLALLVLLGGVLADRFTPRLMMIGADVTRLGVQGAMAVAFAMGRPALWEILAAQAVSGAATAMFQPGVAATIRQVTPDVQRANATLRTAEAIVTMLGPAVAGLLVAVSNPGSVFAVDSATFGVSAACLFGLHLRAATRSAPGQRLWGDLAHGWREFRSRTWLWGVIVISAVFCLTVAGPALPLNASLLILTHGARTYGFVMSAFGVGTVLGGALGLRLKPARPLAAGALAMLGFVLYPLVVAAGLPVALIVAGYLIAGTGYAFWNVMWSTTLQTHIPLGVLNRVSAYDIAGSLVVLPVGQALAGPVAGLAGARHVLFASVVICALCYCCMLAVPPIRNLRRVPQTAPAGSEST